MTVAFPGAYFPSISNGAAKHRKVDSEGEVGLTDLSSSK